MGEKPVSLILLKTSNIFGFNITKGGVKRSSLSYRDPLLDVAQEAIERTTTGDYS